MLRIVFALATVFLVTARPASANPGWVCYGDSDCWMGEKCLMGGIAGCCWPTGIAFSPSHANALIAKMRGQGPLAEKLHKQSKPLPDVHFSEAKATK